MNPSNSTCHHASGGLLETTYPANRFSFPRSIGKALLVGQVIVGILVPSFASVSQAAPVPPTDNTSAPFMGTYEWGMGLPTHGARIQSFANWLSRSQLWVEEFSAVDQWDQIRGPNWLLAPVKTYLDNNINSKCLYTVGMLPGPWDGSGPTEGINAGYAVSLQLGASGAYNPHWKALAENLVARSLVDRIVIRLGHEFNGGWYTWRADTSAKAVHYAEYWRQIVTTMRSVPGGSGLKFCWNGATGWSSYNLSSAYPGDAYVDVIGVDVYDQSWNTNTYPYPAGATPAQILARQQNAWADVGGTANNGLSWWRNLAATRGKPLAIPEWGLCGRSDGHGGGDNPFFIQKMYDFIHEPSNHVAWHVYFDIQAGDGRHQLNPYNGHVTVFPTAATLFQQLFSPAAQIFNDEFTDGDAAGWTPSHPDCWSIVSDASNYGYAHTVNWSYPGTYSTAGANTWSNYTLSAAAKITAMPAWSETRLFGRFTDSNNYYVAVLSDEGTTKKAYIKKRMNGVTTVLASGWFSFSANTWNHLDFVFNGSQISFNLNGVQLLQVTDTSLPSGRIGLGSYKQNILFDDVTVTNF